MKTKMLFAASICFFLACNPASQNDEATTNDSTQTAATDTRGQADIDLTKERLAEVIAIEEKLISAELKADPAQAENLLYKATTFVNTYPKHAEAPVVLMKSIRAAHGLKKYVVAVDALDRLVKNYPDYQEVEQCLYLKAFILDFEMREEDRAKAAYDELLAAFPNSKHAETVKARLESIGLSDEELIRKFEAQNQGS